MIIVHSCSRCGGPIEVDTDALESGVQAPPEGAEIAHAVCPEEDAVPTRWYRATISIEERAADGDWDLIARVSTRTEAPTATLAYDDLGGEINRRWADLGGAMAFADGNPSRLDE